MNKALFAIALLLAAVFLLQNRYYYFHDKRVVFRVDRIMNTVEVRLVGFDYWMSFPAKPGELEPDTPSPQLGIR